MGCSTPLHTCTRGPTRGSFRLWTLGLKVLAGFCFAASALAQERPVTFAGLAFAGDAATLAQRFPHSLRYAESLQAAGGSTFQKTLAALGQAQPRHLSVRAEPLADLKDRDQALVLTLLIGAETVSVERFGDVHKLLVLIRAQALFFDFRSMTVVRSYPLSFAHVDNFSRTPTEADILERVRRVYEGAGHKPGLFTRFARAVEAATVPDATPRFLQVTRVQLSPDWIKELPAALAGTPAVAQTWAADLVSEALSTRLGVPVVPYSKGYAIGNVMSMRVLDGEVFNLALPRPDYEIGVDFTGLKKVKYSQSGAGASFIYGTYATVRIEEPVSGTVYMDTALKNGEVKVVPASQTLVEDFPAYYDSINGLFVKLADAIGGREPTWVKAAAAAPDIATQITKTKELMNLCK